VRGRKRIVKLLLGNDADVSAQGGRFGNALRVASVGGHNRIVELLVDKGADVNAQGGLYSNVLQVVSVRPISLTIGRCRLEMVGSALGAL
jgi:ankyrin repeat protein